MKKHLVGMLPLVVMTLALLGGTISWAQTEVQSDTYKLQDGTNCFLVPVQAGSAKSGSEFVDVAVLVDVSASQLAPEVRQAGQDAVVSLVANLPANARVQIYTVDNETASLTGGFVPLKSPQLQEAIGKLKSNTPLGAADLEKAIRVASGAFDYFEKADRSIAYIGRGTSTVAVFDTAKYGEVVELLVSDRVPFNVFANGSVTNLPVLGAIANQTGGYVVDPTVTKGADAGKLLASATTATVYWPTTSSLMTLSEGTTLYPNPLPPIRSDRETFLIGSSKKEASPQSLAIPVVHGDNVASELKWTVKSGASDARNQYLYRMVE
ncbi:MAG: VWA domain-containing protein, partial [Thermoguttaceae bacterium]|nr:VWA domain-containing protein [Thermoguttaceae bacterium]